jgi:SprT protein
MQAVLDLGDLSPREKIFRDGFSQYVPQESLPYVARYFGSRQLRVKITASRRTKYGDFRTSPDNPLPLITINHDLNPFAFLLTLIHEAAHFECWQKYRHRVKPHGKEWKWYFKDLMSPYLTLGVFPPDVVKALKTYLENPAASGCSDIALMKALKAYDNSPKHVVHLEDLPENSLFKLNKRVFQKGEKRRKLYKCKEIKSQKDYLVNPLCEVVPVNKE